MESLGIHTSQPRRPGFRHVHPGRFQRGASDLAFSVGYGYMLEYPIARIYTDTRAQRIYAGTNEIMREVVARSM